jgi:hypothetical protein
MAGNHCRSCGRRGRLTWPPYAPEVCSMRCAADAFLAYAEVGMFEAAHCRACGKSDTECACGDEVGDG